MSNVVDMNKAYKTSDGCKVKLYAIDKERGEYCVIGSVEGNILRWKIDGKYGDIPHPSDLVEVGKVHFGYINVHHGGVFSRVYSSRGDADKAGIATARLDCIEIKYEEKEPARQEPEPATDAVKEAVRKERHRCVRILHTSRCVDAKIIEAIQDGKEIM